MAFLRVFSRPAAAAVIGLLAGALAGCQTDSTGAPGPAAQAAPKLERHEAAMQCWMSVEKGRKDLSLDTRADIVTRCVDEKMDAAQAAAPQAPKAQAADMTPSRAAPRQPLPWQERSKT
jgi:hypothetical protein